MFALVLTGPPGSGKTTTLQALHDALVADGIAHAAFEVEALSWAHPAPSDEQSFRHVEALRRTYVTAGYELILCAATITSAGYMHGLLAALEADDRLVVGLDAEPSVLRRRIVEREPASWSGLPRLLEATAEIAAAGSRLAGFDARFQTEDERPTEIAAAIRSLRPDLLGGG